MSYIPQALPVYLICCHHLHAHEVQVNKFTEGTIFFVLVVEAGQRIFCFKQTISRILCILEGGKDKSYLFVKGDSKVVIEERRLQGKF